jgi:hypothetical protein
MGRSVLRLKKRGRQNVITTRLLHLDPLFLPSRPWHLFATRPGLSCHWPLVRPIVPTSESWVVTMLHPTLGLPRSAVAAAFCAVNKRITLVAESGAFLGLATHFKQLVRCLLDAPATLYRHHAPDKIRHAAAKPKGRFSRDNRDVSSRKSGFPNGLECPTVILV